MDLIREAIRYDEEKGRLVWARTRGFIRAGEVAGGMVNGAMYVTLDGTRYLAKDIVWYLVRGQWPKSRLYHRNGDKADVSIENLTYDRNKRKAASDEADFGLRIREFGYTVVKLSGGDVEVLATEPGLDKALNTLKGAVLCSE